MGNRNSLSGNPAFKRIGNKKRAERRARCWARGQKRKQARRDAQSVAQRRNQAAGTSPWREAVARRCARRALAIE